MHRGDQQLDQGVGDLPLPLMHQRREQHHAKGLAVLPQVRFWRFHSRPCSPSRHNHGRNAVERPSRQTDPRTINSLSISASMLSKLTLPGSALISANAERSAGPSASGSSAVAATRASRRPGTPRPTDRRPCSRVSDPPAGWQSPRSERPSPGSAARSAPRGSAPADGAHQSAPVLLVRDILRQPDRQLVGIGYRTDPITGEPPDLPAMPFDRPPGEVIVLDLSAVTPTCLARRTRLRHQAPLAHGRETAPATAGTSASPRT